MLNRTTYAGNDGINDGVKGGSDADGELSDDYSEWDDYGPDGIHISEAERQQLQTEHEKYVTELIEEVGEPTAEEEAEAEAWWRPISEHLRKGSSG